MQLQTWKQQKYLLVLISVKKFVLLSNLDIFTIHNGQSL